MLNKNFLDDGEAEPGAGGFGREERKKEFRKDIRTDTGTVVEDGDYLSGVRGRTGDFAADDNFGMLCVRGSSFGGIANKIEQRLAKEAFVSRGCGELAFTANFDLREKFLNFADDTLDKRSERYSLRRDFKRACETEKFGDDVSDVAGLVEDFRSVFGGV